MEVVMIDIDDFNSLFVVKCIRNRPTVYGSFLEVDCAFVVCMVQLGESDERNEPWIINVVRHFFLDNANSVALFFIQQWNATTNRPSLFKSVNDFVVARWIDRRNRTSRSQRAHNWHTGVSLVNVELDFLVILQIGANRNRKT